MFHLLNNIFSSAKADVPIDPHHTTVVTDNDTGRIYTERIPLERDQGLITIQNVGYHSKEYIRTDVSIERHPNQWVEIVASISMENVVRLDPSHPESQNSDGKFYNQNMLWKPFNTDVIPEPKKYFTKKPRLDKLRGGNRLVVTLTCGPHFWNSGCEHINYVIKVPADADLFVNLSQGDITYLTHPPGSKEPTATYKVATNLKTTCDKVNVCGNSGCGGNWIYHWGPESSPVTDLITANGNITLPIWDRDYVLESGFSN